jgi:hypothetical protein
MPLPTKGRGRRLMSSDFLTEEGWLRHGDEMWARVKVSYQPDMRYPIVQSYLGDGGGAGGCGGARGRHRRGDQSEKGGPHHGFVKGVYNIHASYHKYEQNAI